jgi:putative PIN family toxin of toxin-antitoxin system
VRIVADTNTVVSGLLWQGPPRLLLNLARQQQVTLCTSLSLLAELAEVIARAKFGRRLRTADLSAAALVQDYARLAQLVEPQALPAPLSRDPDDDVVLATAAAARAELIVTGDADLLTLGTFRDIRILTTTSALALLAQQRG